MQVGDLVNTRMYNGENVNIVGPWQTADSIPADFASNTGVRMDSLSGSVESSKNKFINNFSYTFSYFSYWPKCKWKSKKSK